jgi:hypothetical protein
MGGWTRWMLGGVAAIGLVACGRSSTAPSPQAPPVPEARRATIDFEALPPPSPPTDGMVWHGCSHAEDGFTVETLSANCAIAGGFVSVHMPPNPMTPDSVDRFIGSVSLANGGWFGVTRLTRAGGGGFALVAIDLDTFNRSVLGRPSDPTEAQTVMFTGTRLDGSTVTQAFTTDLTFPRGETFVFRADFADLARVEWSQLGPVFHQFDNIVVSVRE